MAFSKEWEERYAENTNLSVWPWSDVVIFVMRYIKPFSYNRPIRVLEIGCGAGANIPLFENIGADYCAIEGSQTIVNKLQKRFKKFRSTIVCGDFTKSIPFSGPFDLVLDRCAIPHNNTASIQMTINLVSAVVGKSGYFIGIDWFSTTHYAYKRGGRFVDDKYTKYKFSSGQFNKLGKVHFFNRKHISSLLPNYKLLHLEYKESKSVIPRKGKIAAWNFVAQIR